MPVITESMIHEKIKSYLKVAGQYPDSIVCGYDTLRTMQNFLNFRREKGYPIYDSPIGPLKLLHMSGSDDDYCEVGLMVTYSGASC